MTPNQRTAAARGFTLVEMVMTMAIFGVMAATLTVFVKPLAEVYAGTRNRSALAAELDNAARIVLRDVRRAVPNSIRLATSSCFELVPASSGGRYRMAEDTFNGGSAAVDTGAATTTFDVLSPLQVVPAVGDWVVVANQVGNDVYSGSNRSQITAVATPSPLVGSKRLTINALQFPIGYVGGRFATVDNAQQAVFYVCSGVTGTLDANGNAGGTLYRLKHYGFNGEVPTACPSTTVADVVATQLSACSFVYNANQASTQQSGYISIQLALTRGNEASTLVVGAHVSNVP